MLLYKVMYRLKGETEMYRIPNVAADWVMENHPVAARGFLEEDGTRWEVPADGTIFIFGPEREELIKRNMERQRAEN